MLILNPKAGESISINECIQVTYLGENDKGEPKIGFKAPRWMNIKFCEQKKKKNKDEK